MFRGERIMKYKLFALFVVTALLLAACGGAGGGGGAQEPIKIDGGFALTEAESSLDLPSSSSSRIRSSPWSASLTLNRCWLPARSSCQLDCHLSSQAPLRTKCPP